MPSNRTKHDISMPERNSSITTVSEDFPKLLFLSMSSRTTLASSNLSTITTPFPAAGPSALRTYGPFLLFK